MTERDLDHLKDLPVPAARESGRRAALAAALQAFDRQAEENSATSQGSVVPIGPTETSTAKRSFRMLPLSRSNLALAASLAALVIAAPFAFRHLETLHQTGDSKQVAVTLDLETRPAASPEQDEARAKLDALIARKTAAEIDGASEKQKAINAALERERAAAKAGRQRAARAPVPAAATVAAPPAPHPGFSSFGGMGGGGGGGGMPGEPMADVAASLRADGAVTGQLGLPPTSYLGGAARPSVQAEVFGLDDLAARAPAAEEGRDRFEAVATNPVKQVATDPVSTFSLDVDTASYAFVRRALNGGGLPPKEAVRVEEMINYFPYDYPRPDSADSPFKPTVTVMPSPWNAHNKLVHVAIKGYDLERADRPKANLVFLIDVSGSMEGADRLALIKNAFRLLIDQLKPDDTVGIVTYASGSGILLPPTKIADKAQIFAAIDKLEAGGSTAGAAGIADAYRLAESGFEKSAVNRIILATDGDFNVGISDRDQLKGYIERKRQSGIFLSILGVGSGNHNDALMQALAQNGNGTAAYVDTLNEARKVLVEESSSTLFTIAKDVKVQVEWNPTRIAEYRLIGYETRGLRREDFNNDGVDAGDIGSGHTVTAIYEVTPVGAPRLADDLRYGTSAQETAAGARGPAAAPQDGTTAAQEIGFLKIRYKRPKEETSELISLPLTDQLERPSLQDVPAEQRFSVAVAAFGQLLRGESYVRSYSYDDVVALAQTARGDDPFGYRAEFLGLVRLAKSAR